MSFESWAVEVILGVKKCTKSVLEKLRTLRALDKREKKRKGKNYPRTPRSLPGFCRGDSYRGM